MNTSAPLAVLTAEERVLGWQTRLHRWAVQDEQQRFGDLFNLVCDPATLLVAWERVKRNRGSQTAGVDGQTRKIVERMGVDGVLSKLRQELKDGTYRPLPARERLIPKRSGAPRSYEWVIEGDVEDCFGSIHQGLLMEQVRRRARARRGGDQHHPAPARPHRSRDNVAGSGRGAVPALPPVRFPDPPAEPELLGFAGLGTR